MKDFRSFIVPPDMPAIEAMSVIDQGGKGIVFVCQNDLLLATLTDGDIRRHILRNGNLDTPVSQIGNRQFKCTKQFQNLEQINLTLEKWQLNGIPVLDEAGRIINIHFLETEIKEKSNLNLPVVIMAGGKGTRLYPYTKILPKPLIPVGDLTITEHIMRSFIEYGCVGFTMILNHKKNMIKAYFADKANLACHINFLDENKPLGTGGGLGLLRNLMRGTFFLTNCDILVFEDYNSILEHHYATGNLLTMVCTTKRFTVPYGTVEIDKNGHMASLTEKPSFTFLANTGLYVVESEFLSHVPDDVYNDITDLILACMHKGGKVGIYPINEEKWADMGQPEELEKMREKLMSIRND